LVGFVDVVALVEFVAALVVFVAFVVACIFERLSLIVPYLLAF